MREFFDILRVVESRKFEAEGGPMTPEERKPLISAYAAGYQEVVQALDGFPPDRLGAHPIPGKWSAKEIVHHLADSESTSAIRLRRLLTEENPMIPGYDEAD